MSESTSARPVSFPEHGVQNFSIFKGKNEYFFTLHVMTTDVEIMRKVNGCVDYLNHLLL